MDSDLNEPTLQQLCVDFAAYIVLEGVQYRSRGSQAILQGIYNIFKHFDSFHPP